ncbi:hypothetical protein QZH41_013516 [Actinostola sp. cb2023]|nr:hypothetical protein QZH41_013516 [Actinostola sp. cb2023]
MSCSKCCSADKTSKEDRQFDNDISAEREEILLPSNRNGRVSHYDEHINQRSPGTNEDEDYGKRKIRELAYYYINHCTLHGFHYVFETKSVMRKIIWLSILAVAAGFFFKEIKTSLGQYYLYPFTTMATIEYPGLLPYPAVTICDFHDVRRSLHSTNSTQMLDVINTSLEQLNDTLLYCTLKRGYSEPPKHYTIEDFHVFYSSKGHTCYTFNSGKNNRPIIQGDNIGSKFGLEFILNVQDPGYSDVRESGFQFILHQQDEVPLAREGFRVSPGYVTYVDLRLAKEKNLPYPYKTNCGGKTLKYFTKYSSSNCYLELLTDYVVKMCHCRIWFMPDVSNALNCSVRQTMDCVWPAWERFEQQYNYTCPEDCDKSTYDARLSSALFMPQKLLPVKGKHSYLLQAKDMPNNTEGILEFIMENYVVVTLYFDDLRLDIIEQTPSYGFYKLVGDVGGQLGLVLGASFITLLELIDLFVMWFYFWLKGKAKRRSSRRKSNS